MPNLTCVQCGVSFQLEDEDIRLYKKFDTDPLPVCFDCQHKQRLSFRNERVLYNRKCDATGEDIVSIYAPGKPFKVYKAEYWYSDKWDALDYGREFDFNRPFFEQFKEIHYVVPWLPLVNMNSENSAYCNMCVGNKNCYLIFGGDYNQDCMYGTLCMHNRDSLDIDYSNGSELCYVMDNSANCYGCQYVWDSKNCTNCYYSTDCISCTECIFCSNMQQKSFCINNEQYTKEDYLEKKKEILDGSYKTQLSNWKKFIDLKKNRVVKYGHILACENCTGDYLKNSKNCHYSYDVSDSEDMRHCIFSSNGKDGFNVDLIGEPSELMYNSIAMIGVNIRNSYFIFDCSDIEYSEQCLSSHNLFGCNGLHNKKYCILNTQYSKEEYEILRKKIINHMKKTGEWGQFFPKDLSCFSYNESTAMRYYPLKEQQATEQGFSWRKNDPREYLKQTYQIPDNIYDIPKEIVSEILACETCGKNFKILPKELDFYVKNNIPLPHNCPDCRQKMRTSLRNPCKLWPRTCSNCQTPIQTTYSPEQPEVVYCEKCYLKTIY